ncbi:PucR family transcriptional regulator [Skermania sp. ID1734]|uniref:PucR family transcriptional regulator n=1 Tax=Skermania sp. ID1734 TaxID=2597516 RepID=UPI001180DBA2|nr:helix-turn-helix domain-containing protein [Skermania sp. ID1734]TSD94250.1 PucR family transcriptional regulator [Skermania sp. ID1734]
MTDALPGLITEVANRMLVELDDLVAAMNIAEVDVAPALIADRAIAEEMTASNRANVLQVLNTVLDDPLHGRPRNPPPEAFDIVRTVVRRGGDLDVIFQSYRRGQNVVWHRMMQFTSVVAPPGPAQIAVIERFAEVIFAYVDAVLLELISEAQRLREEMLGGALARRTETVRLILDGAPIDERVATGRLGYELSRRHTALVVWLDGPGGDNGELEAVVTALARAVGARPPLTIAAGVRTMWAWLGTQNIPSVDTMAKEMRQAPARMRAAVGPTLPGLAGFRSSHADALLVAQIVGDNVGGDRLVTFADVEPIVPAARDEPAAARFVAGTLGAIAHDDERGERLRATLRIYLAEAENASVAAERLHTHRNTILQRVGKATELLGYPPGNRRLAVMLALDLAHFVGPRMLIGRPSAPLS